MKTKSYYLKKSLLIESSFVISSLAISFLVIFFLTCFPSPPPLLASTAPKQEIQKLQEEITTLENTLKILSDEKQRSASVSQVESILAAKKGILAQKTGTAPTLKKGRHLNFIQIFQNVKKIFFHLLGLLKEQITRLSIDYTELRTFLSSRDNLLMLLDIGLKLLGSFIIGLLLWFFSRILTRRWLIAYQKREKVSLSGRIKALLFHLFLEFYPLAILFALSWLFLESLFQQEVIVSAAVSVLGAWFVYRLLCSLCRLIISPEDDAERLFILESELVTYIRAWCHRIFLLSLWAFVLVRVCSLFGLEQISTVFLKTYKVGIVTCLAIILTRWRASIQKRFSFTLKEDDPAWMTKMKKAYNRALGKVYLVLILMFSITLTLDLLGYDRAAQFTLLATFKSLLFISLALIVWFLWNRLFVKFSALSRESVQRYPDLEKQVNRYVTWTGHLIRSSIIILTFFILMAIWGFNIFKFLSHHSEYLFGLIRIPALILGSIFLTQSVAFLVRKMTGRIAETKILKEEAPPIEIEKQLNTISGILYKTAAVFIWSVTGTMILKELGFSIGPLLAGAGIAGLAVGFGAQSLVRDIISGLFMIAENQVRVGDVAILNGTGGLVEKVSLRITVLRGLDGTVHVFPNGTINTVSNMTHDFSYYLFDIGVAYKEDVDRVFAVLREIGDQIAQEEPYKSMILEPFEIIGLDKFADSALIIKARIKTQPIQQWTVGREMNRRIKKRFDEEGIEIPFPQRTIYFGDKTKFLDVHIKNWGEENLDMLKDFIRTAIKNALDEEKQKGRGEKED
ncbi:MAG: mechanosensitive ion channel family protein [bacterium]